MLHQRGATPADVCRTLACFIRDGLEVGTGMQASAQGRRPM